MKKLLQKLKKLSTQEIKNELKWMWNYISRFKGYVAIYIVLGLFATSFGLTGSVISKKLINAVTGFDSSSIGLLAALFVAFGVVGIIINSLSNRISVVSNTKVTQDIRQDIFSKVMNVKWEELASLRPGDILNRVNNDVNVVASSVLTWLPTFITKTFQFVCVFCLILYYDKTMAIIALISSPATLIVSSFLLQRMRENTKLVRKTNSDLVAFLGEAFQNIHNVKAFDLLSDFSFRFKVVQKTVTDATLKQNSFSVFAQAIIGLIGLFVSYGCFGWGVYRLWQGAIDFGTMTLFIQLSSLLSSSLNSIIALVPSAVFSTVAARRIMEIVDLPCENTDDREVVNLIKANSKSGLSIEVDNVRFSYKGTEKVFESVDFSAFPGETVALIGQSGAGKTTVLRLLLGLVDCENGEIFIEGVDDKKALKVSADTRKAFAYVPQGHSLFQGTIAENMRLIKPKATDEEIIESLKIACAFDFVDAMADGINSKIGDDSLGLSEGQAQRLAIARAILCDAPIILLDEATSALDVETEKQMLKNISAFAKKKTCILTTHRMSVIDICDRIYKIDNYRIKQEKLM